jgi:Zn finger protein HypA/HybF involved in hydrogenase expression
MLHRFHVYQCADCVAVFAAEDHEDLDHRDIVCPFCHRDDAFIDAGSGEMEVKAYANEGN